MSILGLLLSMDGRIGRSKFWGGLGIWVALIALAAALPSNKLVVEHMMRSFGIYLPHPGGYSPPSSGEVAGYILCIAASMWVHAALVVKRLHDRDKTGAWYFLSWVPVVGLLWTIVELGCLPAKGEQRQPGPSIDHSTSDVESSSRTMQAGANHGTNRQTSDAIALPITSAKDMGHPATHVTSDRFELALRYGRGTQERAEHLAVFGDLHQHQFAELIRAGHTPEDAAKEAKAAIFASFRLASEAQFNRLRIFLEALDAAAPLARREMVGAMNTLGAHFDPAAAERELLTRHGVRLSEATWIEWSRFLGRKAAEHRSLRIATLVHGLRSATDAHQLAIVLAEIANFLRSANGWNVQVLSANSQSSISLRVNRGDGSYFFIRTAEDLVNRLADIARAGHHSMDDLAFAEAAELNG